MKILLSRESFDAHQDILRSLVPDAEWVVLEDDASCTGDPTGADIVYWGGGFFTDRDRLRVIVSACRAPDVQWIQGPAAGVDAKIWSDILDRGVRLTSGSGMWSEPIAQYSIAWVLAWAQGLGGQMLRSQHHEWNQLGAEDLTSSTLGIVGYGGIGKACARIAKAIGMDVIATRRTPGEEPNLDELLSPDRLHELLGRSDYVVIAVPLTDATRDLIGTDEFAAMGDHTVLINVARGEIVDEEALSQALRQGIIRGCTTDVTRTEPLPADSPLWDVPNLVITSHQSGGGPQAQALLDDLFVENLGRYVKGEELINEVFDTGLTHE